MSVIMSPTQSWMRQLSLLVWCLGLWDTGFLSVVWQYGSFLYGFVCFCACVHLWVSFQTITVHFKWKKKPHMGRATGAASLHPGCGHLELLIRYPAEWQAGMKGKGGLLCIKSYQSATYSAQSEDERDGEKRQQVCGSSLFMKWMSKPHQGNHRKMNMITNACCVNYPNSTTEYKEVWECVFKSFCSSEIYA